MAEISKDLREASVLLIWYKPHQIQILDIRRWKVFCSRNLKTFKRFQSGRCAQNKKDNRIQFEFGTILKACSIQIFQTDKLLWRHSFLHPDQRRHLWKAIYNFEKVKVVLTQRPLPRHISNHLLLLNRQRELSEYELIYCVHVQCTVTVQLLYTANRRNTKQNAMHWKTLFLVVCLKKTFQQVFFLTSGEEKIWGFSSGEGVSIDLVDMRMLSSGY